MCMHMVHMVSHTPSQQYSLTLPSTLHHHHPFKPCVSNYQFNRAQRQCLLLWCPWRFLSWWHHLDRRDDWHFVGTSLLCACPLLISALVLAMPSSTHICTQTPVKRHVRKNESNHKNLCSKQSLAQKNTPVTRPWQTKWEHCSQAAL